MKVPIKAGAINNQAAYFSLYKKFFITNPKFTKNAKYYNILYMKKLHIIEIFIFLILISILTFYGIKAFKHTFDIGTTYHIVFKDIDSIVIGSPVRVLGVDVGHVTKIQNATDEIYVDFVINDNNIKLPDGTKASIEFFGIAGSRSIELTPPNSSTEADGLVVSEPIRIGDAFDIMQEFMEATMTTLSGLSDFAKNRSQEDVEEITTKILTTTQQADDKVIGLTSTIQKGGAALHKSFEGTTKGFTRFYNEAEALNISENFNKGKYSVNLAKRTLIQFHRNMQDFHKRFENYVDIVEISKKGIKNIENIYPQIIQVDKAIEELDSSTKMVQKNISKENLDKIYKQMENVKNITNDLNNEI